MLTAPAWHSALCPLHAVDFHCLDGVDHPDLVDEAAATGACLLCVAPWHTDHELPPSAIVKRLLSTWQEGAESEGAARLLVAPYTARLPGSGGTLGQEDARAWLVLRWLIDVWEPSRPRHVQWRYKGFGVDRPGWAAAHTAASQAMVMTTWNAAEVATMMTARASALTAAFPGRNPPWEYRSGHAAVARWHSAMAASAHDLIDRLLLVTGR